MPALNPSTDTTKPYPDSPQYFATRVDGHRTVMNIGGQIIAVTDDERNPPTQTPVVTVMRRHAQ